MQLEAGVERELLELAGEVDEFAGSRYGRAPKPQDPAASDVGLPAKAGFTQHEHRPEKRG